MTDMTILVGRDMSRRWRFARRGDAIVAGCTVVDDTRVIEFCAEKGGGVMTQRAVLGGRQVGN